MCFAGSHRHCRLTIRPRLLEQRQIETQPSDQIKIPSKIQHISFGTAWIHSPQPHLLFTFEGNLKVTFLLDKLFNFILTEYYLCYFLEWALLMSLREFHDFFFNLADKKGQTIRTQFHSFVNHWKTVTSRCLWGLKMSLKLFKRCSEDKGQKKFTSMRAGGSLTCRGCYYHMCVSCVVSHTVVVVRHCIYLSCQKHKSML